MDMLTEKLHCQMDKMIQPKIIFFFFFFFIQVIEISLKKHNDANQEHIKYTKDTPNKKEKEYQEN